MERSKKGEQAVATSIASDAKLTTGGGRTVPRWDTRVDPQTEVTEKMPASTDLGQKVALKWHGESYQERERAAQGVVIVDSEDIYGESAVFGTEEVERFLGRPSQRRGGSHC